MKNELIPSLTHDAATQRLNLILSLRYLVQENNHERR